MIHPRGGTPRYSELLHRRAPPLQGAPHPIGVLPGEGIGPEVIGAALEVLAAVAARTGARFEIRTGGPIGKAAIAACGAALSDEVIAFCAELFAAGGALFCGPGCGRFVYDMRRRFDLYCKLNPLQPLPELRGAGPLRPEHLDGVDVLVVRENTGGVYQGAGRTEGEGPERVAHHAFSYSEGQVRRIAQVAAQAAGLRRGEVAVVTKPAGVPAVSDLWREVAGQVCEAAGVRWRELEIDHAAYFLVQHPRALDVVLAPNLAGDVIADVGAVLLGSRGMSYSASYSEGGAAVYQTNHGAAQDLAGSGRANPVAQILSLGMLLRESFGLEREAALLRAAVRSTLGAGLRTADVAEPGCRTVGIAELAAHIVEVVQTLP